MIISLTGTPSLRKAAASRALSEAAMRVGMVTMMNWVVSAFLNKALASSIRSCTITHVAQMSLRVRVRETAHSPAGANVSVSNLNLLQSVSDLQCMQ